MKCRHPEVKLGDCLAMNLVLYAWLSLFPVCRMAPKIVFPCLQVLYAMFLWFCDLTAKETINGRQGQRLQEIVNKITDSGTRSRSDSVSFCCLFVLCRMALDHISKFWVLYAMFLWFCDPTAKETINGGQGRSLQGVVHKKTNSGTRPKCDSAQVVSFLNFMSDDCELGLKDH